MTQTPLHTLSFSKLLHHCQASNERGLILLYGDERWAQGLAADITQSLTADALANTDILNIEHGLSSPPVDSQNINAKQVANQLGQEYSLLLWNGHRGLNPNELGAASGLLKGGGLMLLLLPPKAQFLKQVDPDYSRMCAYDYQLEACSQHFHQRLVAKLEAADNTLVLEEHDSTWPATQLEHIALANRNPIEQSLPSADQLNVISALERVLHGHRKRPLVITADRGRGKSAALGMAAAKLVQQNPKLRILITAPQQAATKACFKHYQAQLGQNQDSALRFVAPDELIATRLPADLVLVDEAAGIPVPMLKTLLLHYSRIAFASTIHGYEGAGQGFSVRFKALLDEHRPQWQVLSLTKPIRWADGDPLEQAINRLLCLDAQYPEQLPDISLKGAGSELSWLSREQLAQDEHLLSQVMALLTQAHYQTSPSDLRMLLDHPDVRLLSRQRVSDNGPLVEALAFTLLEEPYKAIKELSDTQALTNQILTNQRRLKGLLTAQSLASSYQAPDLLSLSNLRVVRVTCHPALRRQGLASQLIKQCEDYAKHEGIDYLSVSYGLRAELSQFWQHQGLVPLKLGYKSEKASGAHALLAVKAISAAATQAFDSLAERFREQFIFGLNRYYQDLAWQDVRALLAASSNQGAELSPQQVAQLQSFAYGKLSEYDCHPALFKLATDAAPKGLSEADQALIIMRILQFKTWPACISALAMDKLGELKGKKDAEMQLRFAVKVLLELKQGKLD